jgi:hypothetical protein
MRLGACVRNETAGHAAGAPPHKSVAHLPVWGMNAAHRAAQHTHPHTSTLFIGIGLKAPMTELRQLVKQ